MATLLPPQIQRGYVLEIAVEAEEEEGFQLMQEKGPALLVFGADFQQGTAGEFEIDGNPLPFGQGRKAQFSRSGIIVKLLSQGTEFDKCLELGLIGSLWNTKLAET